MDDYREEVERLAQERDGTAFYNSSIDHAAVIIEKMFRHAKKEVCIISSHLNARVFGQEEVVAEADAFLSNANHRVRIVIEDDVDSISSGHPLSQVLRRHSANHEVRQLPQHLCQNVPYHFTLADDDSYRFEPDKDTWQAVASFGDEDGAKKLRAAFDDIWKAARHVDLPVSA